MQSVAVVMMYWIPVAVILSIIPSLIQGRGYLIDRDLITKKDGFKFNFRSGSGVVREKGFHSLGCWKDKWTRAIELLEKKHELLMDGNYKMRQDPLRKCAIAALDKKMKLFAIENGGQCFGAVSITSSYKKYGEAHHCREDGYGGPFSMQVYGFTERRDGRYSEWSLWTKCSGACGKGTHKRFRTCTHPSPAHGGRDCTRLGPGMETEPCEAECLGTENDELENPSKTRNSMTKHKQHSKSTASKKSEDADEYLDDDDYDDPDDDDDSDDKTIEDKSSDGKNENKPDESDSDTSSSHDTTGETIDENKNPKASLSPPSVAGEGTGSLAGNTNENNDHSMSDGVKPGQENSLSPLPVTNKGTSDTQSTGTNDNNDDSKDLSTGVKNRNANNVPENDATENHLSDISSTRMADGNADMEESGQTTADTEPDIHTESASLGDARVVDNETSGSVPNVKEPSQENKDVKLDNTAEDVGKDAHLSGGESLKGSDVSNSENSSDAPMNAKQPDPATKDATTANDNEDTNDGRLSGEKSTKENDVSNSSSDMQEANQSSDTDTKTDNEGENTDDNASDSQLSTDDKSLTENDPLDASNSADDETSMKGQSVVAGDLHSEIANDKISGIKNDLPDRQQMKAAQDLLRSRWLSLAKSGRLRSPSTTQSDIKAYKSTQPVVDASLHDDNTEDFEDQDMEEDDDNEKKVDEEKAEGEKIGEQEVDGQKTDSGWKEEEHDKKPEETQMDEKLDDKTMEGEKQERKNENIQMNDNKAAYGGEVTQHEANEQKMNEESTPDHTMSEMEQHEETSNEHKENVMEQGEEQGNGGVMNDKMSQEDGAKRIKEECICPVLDLMGKPGPNTKPCPCMTQPSKKTSAEEKPDEANTKMTREEYKTGMFHASGLPKVDTTSTTSPQPSTKTPGTSLPTASSISPPKKPQTVMSETEPSSGNLPVHSISPVKTGASQPGPLVAPDKTSTTNQNVVASPQPATQAKPAITPSTIEATQSKPAKANDKIIHIKHDKLKPLSKTLSALGESLNKAHDKGELKEGDYALDSDIHNLLKTIGKLKSQVDILRNDQAQLGSQSGTVSTVPSQSGAVSTVPSQSQDTRISNNQSSPSLPSTSQSLQSSGNAGQSQSSTVSQSGPSKSLGNNDISKSDAHGGHLPLKLQIIDKMANKQQKKPTTLHVKLSNKFKQATKSGKPLVQNASTGKISTNSASQNTLVQATDPSSTTLNPSTESLKKPDNLRTGDIPLSSSAESQTGLHLATKVAQQNTQTTLPAVEVSETTKQPQSNTGLKQPQEDVTKTGVSAEAQNTKPSKEAAGNMFSTSHELSAKPQSSNQAQATVTNAKETANAPGNAKQSPLLTTVSQTAKAPSSVPTTNVVTQSKTALQDIKPAIENPPTNSLPQQNVVYKANPTAPKIATQVTAPQGNTLSQASTTAPQKPSDAPTQSDVTNSHTKIPQSNTFTQQSLHQNTAQNAPAPNTSPTSVVGNQGRKPVQNKIKDFSAIESQLAKIVQTQKATPKSTIPDCNINLGFVLDGSASVEGTRRGNFLKMINFVKDMIHEFVVLSQQVHVGTLVYSTNSSVILSFGTKGTEKVIDQILDSVHYPGQGSLTGKALKDSWNQMFSAVPRGRKSKLVLLTDGPSNDDVKMPSKWIRDNGVEVFVIGLGKGYDEGQIQDMASLPNDRHIMYKDYDGLKTSIQEVRNKVCGFNADEVLRIMTSARMSDNLKEINAFQRSLGRNQCILDVVFLLDGSRQVETNGAGNFQREINFVKKVAEYLPLSRNDVHIGVGLLGDSNVMVFPMNEHYTRNSLAYELDHIRYPASSDIQPQEIQYARQMMLMKGVRDVAPRVFVLVTDVSSLDSYRRAMNELRTDGSDVAMFGVGPDVYKQEVKVRSTVPGLVDQVMTLDNLDESEAAKRFATNICKLSNAKRTEIPRLHWKASDKVLNKN